MDMKSLSALRFNLGSALDSYDQDLSRDVKVSSRNSDETNSPDARREANHERDSSSSNYSSPSSSSSSPQHSPPSPPSHALLPPPLLPLASFTDPPPLMPLLSSFVPARFGHPGTFLSFPQPTNGSSFMPFHHPASVLLRQHQAALAYSYVLMNVQQQQQQLLRQEKQLNKDRAAIFRPHEILDHHHQQQQHHPPMVNSSAERPYYIQSSKVVPFERNDTRFTRKKMAQETSFLSDQLPVDLRKVISPMGDDAARYNNHHRHQHHNHHQQQQQVLALSTPKKNPTSGKKLIGIRFLFPPFADHVTLYERAKIWVARHEYKYFVDWSADDLLKVDIELRPIHPITRQQYKVHMNRSEFCRNVKLKFCLQTDSPWARDFCEKLQKSPAEGGFTGLCQAKIAAADLWRSYSENYRSHQARQPNGSSLKGSTSVKTSSTKKRLATADESPSKKCARINALTSCNRLASKLSDSDAEQFMDYAKLRNNSYYYYYYRQYNNDVKFQAGRDYMSDHERKPANRERGRNSSPGRCLAQRNDQSESLKISEDEINDVDDDVRTGRLTDKTANNLVHRKPSSIWTPFGKPSTKHYGDHDVQRDRFVGDPSKKKSDEMKCDSSRFAGDEKLAVDEIATRPDRFSDQQQHQIDLFFQSGSTASGTPFTSKILEEFGKKILNLRADDFLEFRKSTGTTGSDINNNNVMLDKCTVDKSCGAIKRDDGRCKQSFQPISKHETNRNTAVSSGATNQIEEKSQKSCQNFDYKQVSVDKSRSGRFVEPINEGDPRSGESLKLGSERRIILDVFRQDRRSCQNDGPVWASASKVPEDSASCEDEESDGEVDVVDVGDYQAGSNTIEENVIT